MGGGGEGDVVVPAGPGASFEVVQAQAVFEFAVVVLDAPAQFRAADQILQCGVGGQAFRSARLPVPVDQEIGGWGLGLRARRGWAGECLVARPWWCPRGGWGRGRLWAGRGRAQGPAYGGTLRLVRLGGRRGLFNESASDRLCGSWPRVTGLPRCECYGLVGKGRRGGFWVCERGCGAGDAGAWAAAAVAAAGETARVLGVSCPGRLDVRWILLPSRSLRPCGETSGALLSAPPCWVGGLGVLPGYEAAGWTPPWPVRLPRLGGPGLCRDRGAGISPYWVSAWGVGATASRARIRLGDISRDHTGLL
ncbi:hypothetical protein GCM10010289_81760 [Streptomyces violascens]|uniref:Uncharacterized protein n=1 Tax=Streptomyces violascens TaxID=67381 RepID=A0ABQ3QRF5_9ACTN|nr:hypothetical protein GCM10010289_81760 [Streptomyces violascens]GHI39865.1 hypothetical protein Sviol_42730 [Streptomyces violascens]